MKFFLAVITLLLFTPLGPPHAAAATEMKLEGSCSGTLADGMTLRFHYFSDYDGCKQKSQAAVTFIAGQEGLLTGTRIFRGNEDIYQFTGSRLTLKNSTGNTSGVWRYLEPKSNTYKSVELTCEVRDYEYADC